MTDYCSCGSVADFRCQCGATLCRIHRVDVDVWSLGTPGQAHAVSPVGRLRGALANAWGGRSISSCGECAYRTSGEVARSWAAVLTEHGRSSPEAAAIELIRLGYWNFGWAWQPRSIGQLTVDAFGAAPAWSHNHPDQTAAGILAASGPAPDLVWVSEVGKSLISKRPKYRSVPSVPAWFTEYSWEAGERVDETSGVFITADGQLLAKTVTTNDRGEVVIPPAYADELRRTLTDPTPRAVPAYVFGDTMARARAIARLFETSQSTQG
jgi:hypothetical protein